LALPLYRLVAATVSTPGRGADAARSTLLDSTALDSTARDSTTLERNAGAFTTPMTIDENL
jgi:hypothetical protein